jgi:hypothetical protein
MGKFFSGNEHRAPEFGERGGSVAWLSVGAEEAAACKFLPSSFCFLDLDDPIAWSLGLFLSQSFVSRLSVDLADGSILQGPSERGEQWAGRTGDVCPFQDWTQFVAADDILGM